MACREIMLGNGWPPTFFDEAVEEPAMFWKPLLAKLTEVLCHAPNVEKLKTHMMPLDLDFLTGMVALSRLHTFESFNGMSPIWETTLDLPQSPSVLNVHLSIFKEPNFSMWNVLVLFPNLSVLTVSGSEYFLLPPAHIRAHLPIFRTLRRVFLDWIDLGEVDALCEWIQTCKASFGPLQLTHFKVQSMFGLARDQIVALVDALSSAPMEILVLEGLGYVGGDVFQSIAQTFPGLRALTLVYRQNDVQRRTEAAEWPYTSWELAQQLAAFPSLKHFGCNFRVPTLDASPCMMVALENDFLEDLEFRKEDESYFTDDYVVPRLWAVHCPTLETAAIVARNMRGSRISRQGGQVHVVRVGDWWNDWDIARYNPDGLLVGQSGWPDILPSGNV